MPELGVTFHEHEQRHFDIEKLPVYRWIHASPDCKTYSPMARGTHQRDPTTGKGISSEADKADQDLAFYLKVLKSQMKRNPNLQFTLENPYNPSGGMHCQKLIKEDLVKGLKAEQCKLNCA